MFASSPRRLAMVRPLSHHHVDSLAESSLGESLGAKSFPLALPRTGAVVRLATP
jgi:hypothetical protein